ncbi:MAG: LamG-like jellyroll fold domain-containing protein, partial [Candidatus Margulisiibacteriota bacterium]|nr:LamG-like jellyroll fold domain-containing protein [Candidatus Margulisiibacteriota bacterium]
MVEKRNKSKIENYFFGQLGLDSANQNIHLGYRSDTEITLAHHNNDLNANVRGKSGIDISAFRFKKDQSPSHFINYNGELIANSNGGSALTNMGNNLIGLVRSKNGSTVTNKYYDGEIKEIMVFNTNLSDSDLNKINYYLSKKWSLTNAMDSDGDGYTDAEEIAFGSSPIDASSKIEIDFSTAIHNQIGNGANDLDGLEANLKLWLDAKNINGKSNNINNTSIADDTSIARWLDLSGNGHVAKQPTASEQAKFDNNSIKFDGTNDVFSLGSNILKNTPYTIITVEKRATDGANWLLGQMGGNLTGSATYNKIFQFGYSNTNNLYFDQYHNGIQVAISAKTSLSDITIGTSDKNATNQFNLYYNGAIKKSGNGTNKDELTTEDGGPILIGTAKAAPGFYNGEFNEILIFNKVLSTNERIKINYYLSTKWGLTTKVDSDGDGYTDAEEIAFGSSPTDPTSKIKIDFSTAIHNQISNGANDLNSIESNLKLWLDAKNINAANNTGIANDALIGRWFDLSGHGNVAQQTATTAQGKYNSASTGITLDGTNDAFVIPNNTTMTVTNYSVLMVVKPNGTPASAEIGLFGKPGRNNQLKITNDNKAIHGFKTSTNNNDGIANAGSINYNAINLIEIAHSGTLASTFINGFKSVSTAKAAQVAVDGITYLGQNPDGTTDQYFNGEILEVMLFDQPLSTANRNKINYYLSKKWGLTNAMDSDGDGYTDAEEIAVGSSPIDASSKIEIDFSTAIHNQIGNGANDLDGLEANLKLWLDAKNINATENAGIANNDTITRWIDLSGSGHVVQQKNETSKAKYNIASNSLIFDGVNDYYFHTTNETLANTTMIVVTKLGNLDLSSSTNSGAAAISI